MLRDRARGGLRALVLAAGGTAILATTVVAAGPTPASTLNPAMRAGSRVGPVAIGTSDTQVASLRLSAGNWTVFAKGSLRSKEASGFVAHKTECHLGLEGGLTDRVTLSPIGAGNGSSRQAFLLTTSANLPGIRSATLVCFTDAGGKVVAENLRMVAVKTAALTLDPLSGATSYGNLTSKSQVVSHETSTVGLNTSSLALVSSFSVPAGSWVFTAKATVNSSVGLGGTTECRLYAGGNFDVMKVGLMGKDLPGDHAAIALETVNTYSSPGTVQLKCVTDSAGTDLTDGRIVGYRVASLTNQAASNPFFGAKTAQPVANATFWDGPVTAKTAFTRIAQESLPAGKWAVIAKVYLEHDATGAALATCQLGTSSSNDTTKVVLPPGSAFTDGQPVELIWYGTLASRISVRLRCQSADGKGEVFWAKMVAYQATALRTYALN
ncbi:MAG: hypothetical protein U0869_21380 [Chloroflexota bacterium]